MSSNNNNEANTDDSILLEELIGNGVYRLTLNDAKKRNALSEEMMAKLKSLLTDATDKKSIRVIIIAGNGPAFCSGHDLKQMTAGRNNDDQGLTYFKKVFASCSELMQMIVEHPKPIIAEVSGVAAAAGCQLVACCDLAVAGKSARFITPGVNIGLFCSTPMVALSRNVPNKAAMEMLLTGEMVSALRIPSTSITGQSNFLKLGARSYLVISISMAALRLDVDKAGMISTVALSIGACSEVAMRMERVESALY